MVELPFVTRKFLIFFLAAKLVKADGKYFWLHANGKILSIGPSCKKMAADHPQEHTISGLSQVKGDESKKNEQHISNLGAENNQEKVKVTQTKASSDDTEQEKKIWRKKETLALLSLYKENIMQFENKKYKQKRRCGLP